jgi:hypothetical protein
LRGVISAHRVSEESALKPVSSGNTKPEFEK